MPVRKGGGHGVDLAEVPAEQYPRVADHFDAEFGMGFVKCEVTLGPPSGVSRRRASPVHRTDGCSGNLRVSALAGIRMFATLEGYS